MICPLDDKNYCSRHRTVHSGPSLEIARDPSDDAEAHRVLWDRAAALLDPAPLPTITDRLAANRCPYLGEPTGDEKPCPTCNNGTVMVPLMTCKLHGTCTESRLAKKDDGSLFDCCSICKDHPRTKQSAAKSKRAIFTVNIGKVLHSKSRDSMQDAANRWGAQFVEITSPIHPGGYPHWQRVHLAELARTRGYEKCIYYDADILIRSDCPNVFDLVPAGKIGVVTNDQIDGNLWKPDEQNRYFSCLKGWADRLKMEIPPTHEHANSGMIVFEPVAHQPIFDAWREAGRSARFGNPYGLMDQAALSVILFNQARDQVTWLPMQFNTLTYRHELFNMRGRMQTFVYHITGDNKGKLGDSDWQVGLTRAARQQPKALVKS